MRDLQIVSAVAQSGSMIRAADQLAVSQPVVSKAIADLERLLGVRLFDRTPHGVEPTSFGDALVRCGIAVFDDIKRGVAELAHIADPTVGEVHIGAPAPLAMAFLPRIIDHMARQYPRIRFFVVEGDSATLVGRELHQRRIDFALAWLFGSEPPDDTSTEVLFHDRWVVTVGANSKWLRRRKIALSDLMDEPWVLPPPESMPGRMLVEGFRAVNMNLPRASVVSFSIPLHHYLLATGHFVTMLPMSVYWAGAGYLPLKPLPVASPIPAQPLGIITLKNRPLSPTSMLFLEAARAQAKSLGNLNL
jgi:DNA-binding transcriptional LysR family regulator